jgi:methionyl-tRNA synthetase
MDEITIDGFQKIDIRIGTVVDATVPEWSHWVMKMAVDLGEEIGTRTIFAGIMKFYKPEELKGKQFPFAVNMKPKRIGPPNEAGDYEYSQGMMLAADLILNPDEPEDGKPVLFKLQEEVPNGTKVR